MIMMLVFVKAIMVYGDHYDGDDGCDHMVIMTIVMLMMMMKALWIKVLIFSGGSFEWQRGGDFNSFTSDKRTSFSHIHHLEASCFLKQI